MNHGSFQKTEQNYSAQEHELLAIVHGLKNFRGFIEGLPVLVRTDHKSLKHFKPQKHLNRRLAQFVDEIEFFDCHIIYRPGKEQLAADSLSHKPNADMDLDPPKTARPLFTINHEEDSFSTLLRYKRQLQANIDPAIVGSGNFRLSQNHLMRLNPEDLSAGLLPVPVSEQDSESICFQIHDDLGHRNEKDTIDAVKKRYWFPNI